MRDAKLSTRRRHEQAAEAAVVEPAIPAGFAAPEIEASRLLREIGTPDALAAVAALIDAGERRCAAFRRAAEILLAATPTPRTEH